MSWGRKCLSHTILFTVNCKLKIELHSLTHSYKINNKNFNERTSKIILKQYLWMIIKITVVGAKREISSTSLSVLVMHPGIQQNASKS